MNQSLCRMSFVRQYAFSLRSAERSLRNSWTFPQIASGWDRGVDQLQNGTFYVSEISGALMQ